MTSPFQLGEENDEPPIPLHGIIPGQEGLVHDIVPPSQPSPVVRAYHGSNQDIETFKGDTSDSWVPDRALGTHFAADPKIASKFASGLYRQKNDGWNAPRDPVFPGGRVYPVDIDTTGFKTVDQPLYDWAIERGASPGTVLTDQTAIGNLVNREGYLARPDLLAKYLVVARHIPESDAQRIASEMVSGGSPMLDGKPHDIDRFIYNYVGTPYSAEDRAALVAAGKKRLLDQGVKGLQYLNTSPSETEGIDNAQSYIPLARNTVKNAITGNTMYNKGGRQDYASGGAMTDRYSQLSPFLRAVDRATAPPDDGSAPVDHVIAAGIPGGYNAMSRAVSGIRGMAKSAYDDYEGMGGLRGMARSVLGELGYNPGTVDHTGKGVPAKIPHYDPQTGKTTLIKDSPLSEPYDPQGGRNIVLPQMVSPEFGGTRGEDTDLNVTDVPKNVPPLGYGAVRGASGGRIGYAMGGSPFEGGDDDNLIDASNRFGYRNTVNRGANLAQPIMPQMGAVPPGGGGTGLLTPAIKFRGQTYTGTNHAEAIDSAAKDHGIDFNGVAGSGEIEGTGGFITRNGQYLDRRDASTYASAHGLQQRMQGRNWLSAQDLGSDTAPGRTYMNNSPFRVGSPGWNAQYEQRNNLRPGTLAESNAGRGDVVNFGDKWTDREIGRQLSADYQKPSEAESNEMEALFYHHSRNEITDAGKEQLMQYVKRFPNFFYGTSLDPREKASGGAVHGYAFGGSPFGAHPFNVERAASIGLQREGFLNSGVAGRTDHIGLQVRNGSYVIPADVVSAAGQGNSLAGASAFDRLLKQGPYGTSVNPIKASRPMMPSMRMGNTMRMSNNMGRMNTSGFGSQKSTGIPGFMADGGAAKKPRELVAPREGSWKGLSAGGVSHPGADHSIPILAAGGEYVVSPEAVASVGGGDQQKGFRILDKLVLLTRKKHIDTLRKLKPPKKK